MYKRWVSMACLSERRRRILIWVLEWRNKKSLVFCKLEFANGGGKIRGNDCGGRKKGVIIMCLA